MSIPAAEVPGCQKYFGKFSMSGTFSGFSEDDIKRAKNGERSDASINTKPINKSSKVEKQHKTVTFKNVVNKKSKPISKETSIIPEVFAEIPNDAKLSSSLNISQKPEVPRKSSEMIVDSNMTNGSIEAIINSDEGPVQLENVTGPPEKRILDLDEFQARQKLIEEQNRKRKELLAKALADRTKQTQEEAQRLNEIQQEFKKLDAILSNDVAILRRQIDAASFEYMEVQKRYNRIEREFLDAKMALHQKLERKEMLTEHLCAIIEKNEERKAEKLSELLKKLQMDPDTVFNDEEINKSPSATANSEEVNIDFVNSK